MSNPQNEKRTFVLQFTVSSVQDKGLRQVQGGVDIMGFELPVEKFRDALAKLDEQLEGFQVEFANWLSGLPSSSEETGQVESNEVG